MNELESSEATLPEDSLLPPNTKRALPIALLRSREAVMVRFRPLLAAHGVTEQQWRVIRVLGEESPLDASELAERACVLAPSLTRIIKALEDRKLIRRQKDEEDGRRVLLSIARAGLDLLHEVTPESRAIYSELEAQYGRERIELLIDMLNDLAALKP
ncbi:homoprotocatechuate degradation operon regulator HpaR [Aquamicrobium sp. LC103]|uniref:homoprotocatechuate degradation operon regulator HpaR n=1 Tax=Aquamicrobium sp. LC103 TaxID=1120658 RepID=UPI00063EC547|nr:homoprotocatechuate degradation operon regulator HpaR [Aquamicrobium sp. LC103]TKT79141.1 homoprotocatechuate degradation operon regulator HpaR [Aquamicrobium sp. LC103]